MRSECNGDVDDMVRLCDGDDVRIQTQRQLCVSHLFDRDEKEEQRTMKGTCPKG